MINMIFNSEKRLTGYTTVSVQTTSDKVIKQVSESELNQKIPDSFDAESWKEVRQHYKLEDGEIVFDEDYETKQE